jgi:Uri superfamily endonuclease
MEKYNEGKIYLLKCKNDPNLIYVGSTINTLYNRLKCHRADSKLKPNTLLYKTINNDWDNWTITLYENYKCETKQQLQKREGEIIRLFGTLNTKIEGRTHKEYYDENRNAVLKQKKEYYTANRDKILESKKAYYNDNKKIISMKSKARYIYNKHTKHHYSNIKNEDAPISCSLCMLEQPALI